nr:NADH dehydrogenase subunit 2 [Pessoaiella absita]
MLMGLYIYFWISFILVNLVGVMLSFSSNSISVIWVMMELSSIFFIPFIVCDLSYKSMLSSMKYILIQLSGTIFLMVSMMESMGSSSSQILSFLAILMKIGFVPFCAWDLHLSSVLSWWSFFYSTTIQKIIPLIFLSKVTNSCSSVLWDLFIIFSFISMVYSLLGMYSESSVRWLLMYSGFFSLNWSILSCIMGLKTMIIFLVSYILSSLIMISILYINKGFSQMFSFYWSEKLNFIDMGMKVMMIMGMGGFPPTAVFMGKLYVLYSMKISSNNFNYISDFINYNNGIYLLVLIVLSSMSMYLFVRFSISWLIFSKDERGMFSWYNKFWWLGMIIIFVPFIIMYMYIYM